MKLDNVSFKLQFYISLMGIVLLVLLAAFSYNILSVYQYKKDSFIQESQLQAGLIADSSVAPILFFDQDGLSASLAQLDRYENILQVLVYLNDGELYSSYTKNGTIVELKKYANFGEWFLKDMQMSDSLGATSFVIKQKISFNGEEHGVLYLQKDASVLYDFIRDAIVSTLLFSLLIFVIMLIMVQALSRKLITPIVDLSEELTELSLSQNYSIRLKYHAKNEIGKLYSAFNNLFHSIEVHQDSRDEALAQAREYQLHLEELTSELEERVHNRTQELQDSLDTLKRTQNQLIESEKMAALGSLVSGVAHEVNTPLGNAITGSTIIKKETAELLSSMKGGTLKKSSLESSLEHMDETSRLLYKSLNTAAELIKSFKRISVDQSIEQKREFDLVEYVGEIVKTFHNKLKQVPVNVDIVAPKTLMINSYPGDFAQLLNNFIQNSIIHGFEFKKEDTNITIQLSKKGNMLTFIYSDNGAGMSDEFKTKAFEPFVTTKRNAGGTGLGLNIAYNIVTQKLHGTIKLDTAPNKGVKYTMKIKLED